jgi:hypothetical protein
MPDGTPGFEAAAELEVPVELLPQAAATRAAAPTTVSRLTFDRSWDPRPLIPSCKRIRPLPSNTEPTVYDAVRTGSDSVPPSRLEAAIGWLVNGVGFVNSSNEKSP